MMPPWSIGNTLIVTCHAVSMLAVISLKYGIFVLVFMGGVPGRVFCYYSSVGGVPDAYGMCLSIRLYFQVTFLHNAWKLTAETCFASRTRKSFEKYWTDFWFKALLSTYGVLLPAIQSPEKNRSLTAGCLSTWQFNVYKKSDADLSEI